MFVEFIYDKRYFAELPETNDRILAELEKRIHNIFPDAEVRVKPMAGNSSINTDANKAQKGKISEVMQEMFDDASMWLVDEF